MERIKHSGDPAAGSNGITNVKCVSRLLDTMDVKRAVYNP